MIKKILTHWTSSLFTLAILAIIGFSNPDFKEIIKLKSFDFLLASEEQTFSEDIFIVEIDEATLDVKGQYPFSRVHYSFLIEKLRDAGAGVIVFPILFSEEDRADGDWVFKETLKAGTVIAQLGTNDINKNGVPRGVAKIGDPLPYLFEWGGMLGPIPELGQSANGVGVVNTAPELDGVVRRVPLLMRIGEDVYPSIAIEVIRVAVGDPSYQVKAGEGGIQAMRVPGFATIETDANARVWLRHDKTFHTMSMIDVEEGVNDLLLFGKTVIVSPTAAGISNIIATPRGEQYSHYITASTLQTVLSGESATPEIGNAMPVNNIPLGTIISCIELNPGKGASISRSAGSFAQLMAKEGRYVTIKLPSGETRMILNNCYATIGAVSNSDNQLISSGKAGRKRWLGRRPRTRPVAMNPVDHPMGGGEGKASGGHPRSRKGIPAKGFRTRSKKKSSSKFIIERRKK